MADTAAPAKTATTGPANAGSTTTGLSVPALPTGIQKYLDRAVSVLQKFGVAPT